MRSFALVALLAFCATSMASPMSKMRQQSAEEEPEMLAPKATGGSTSELKATMTFTQNRHVKPVAEITAENSEEMATTGNKLAASSTMIDRTVDFSNFYVRMPDTNFNGGDIDGRPDPTIFNKYDDCAFHCIETPRCKGFTWDTGSHECFLKDEGWAQESVRGQMSGMVTKHLSDLYIPMRDVDFNEGGVGGLRDSTIQKSADRCALNCVETSQCIGFTWDKVTSECFLKEGGWTAIPNSGRLSGTIKPSAVQSVLLK